MLLLDFVLSDSVKVQQRLDRILGCMEEEAKS